MELEMEIKKEKGVEDKPHSVFLRDSGIWVPKETNSRDFRRRLGVPLM